MAVGTNRTFTVHFAPEARRDTAVGQSVDSMEKGDVTPVSVVMAIGASEVLVSVTDLRLISPTDVESKPIAAGSNVIGPPAPSLVWGCCAAKAAITSSELLEQPVTSEVNKYKRKPSAMTRFCKCINDLFTILSPRGQTLGQAVQ